MKQQLSWEDGDSDYPGKPIAITDAQLDKFEAVEKVLGIRISNAVSDEPMDTRQGIYVERVGKETTGKRNGRKSREW